MCFQIFFNGGKIKVLGLNVEPRIGTAVLMWVGLWYALIGYSTRPVGEGGGGG